MIVELPWPPSKLNPNSGYQGDWRGKATARKKYRANCLILAKNVSRGFNGVPDGYVMVNMRFYPPDRRRRDLDNLLSMCKQGIDAIAEALSIDDSRFEYTLRRGEPVKGGKVEVTI